MTNETKNLIISGIIAAAGIAAAVIGLKYANDAREALEKAAEAIQCSVDDISSGAVNIPRSLVEAAVQHAAIREVELATGDVVDRAARAISSDVAAKATKIINDSYTDIRKTVDNAIDVAINSFDIDRYKTPIVEKCANIASAKLANDLNFIANQYKAGMDTGTTILMAKAAAANSGNTIRIVTG